MSKYYGRGVAEDMQYTRNVTMPITREKVTPIVRTSPITKQVYRLKQQQGMRSISRQLSSVALIPATKGRWRMRQKQLQPQKQQFKKITQLEGYPRPPITPSTRPTRPRRIDLRTGFTPGLPSRKKFTFGIKKMVGRVKQPTGYTPSLVGSVLRITQTKAPLISKRAGYLPGVRGIILPKKKKKKKKSLISTKVFK